MYWIIFRNRIILVPKVIFPIQQIEQTVVFFGMRPRMTNEQIVGSHLVVLLVLDVQVQSGVFY